MSNKCELPNYAQKGKYSGKSLAIFTSGGDSQGMNSALRACVRVAIHLGCKTYFIHEGYQGMVDGGDNIVEANNFSVSSIIHLGGTIIGSARCNEFRERAGRLRAANNLVQKHINNLVAMGGDGTLTGIEIFRKEWPSLMDELLTEGKITLAQREQFSVLHIVGMVATIDNDFVASDMTIGSDSSLHRIMEVIDAVNTTACSHKRVFIIQPMGKFCGYLPILTAIISEADFMFCPESPPPNNWPDMLCQKLVQDREGGQRVSIIIVSESARDLDGEPITPEDVKKVVDERLQFDTRINVLGHLQRGGNPSAFDRVLACRMGAEAAVAAVDSSSETLSVVIAIVGNEIKRVPLMESVDRIVEINNALKEKNWELAVDLRGKSFKKHLDLFSKLKSQIPSQTLYNYNLAVMHIGGPACGMNAAVYGFTRYCIYNGCTPYAIHDGVDGLIADKIHPLKSSDVTGWIRQGGANLGANNTMPEGKFKEIAARLREHNIQGLVVIGGFAAYHGCGQLFDQRLNFPEFCIPICVIASSISNNVPGTDTSLGSDTSLNVITEVCDRIRQSAQGRKRRVFVIETMGGYCGYLATLAALAGGADAAYIFEEEFSILDMQKELAHMVAKINAGVPRGLILVNENASRNFNSDFIHRLFAEEGKDLFTCRMNVIGHMQEGGSPSPYDRQLGTKFGARSVDWIINQIDKNVRSDGVVKCVTNESACVYGIVSGEHKFTPLVDLIAESDFEHRYPLYKWWLSLRPLLQVISKHLRIDNDDIVDIMPPKRGDVLNDRCYC